MKKILLILALLSASILFAQTATPPITGNGSSGNPYQIATLNNLYWLSSNPAVWGLHFKQTADINASSTSTWNWDPGMGGYRGWSPIGNGSPSFTGSYDGGGHTIDQLFIRDGEGFFGDISGASISYLGLTGINVQAPSGTFVGGLAGKVQNNSNISKCYVSGSVSGSVCVGGLVGMNVSSTISDCYSTASVSAADHDAGGLVGGNGDNYYNTGGTISNSYSTGSVYAHDSGGGLIGGSPAGSVTNSFWDTETSGYAVSNGGGTGKTTTEMQTQSTFTGWDFTSIWQINGTHYPVLRFGYTISITSVNGIVAKSPDQTSYNSGTAVTLTATPADGYTFTNWTENGTVVWTFASYPFIISANRTLVANFAIIPPIQYSVLLSSSPEIGGTTTGSAVTFSLGSSVTVIAIPATGYTFTNWTENGTIVSTNTSYTFTISTNTTLVANFAVIPPTQYTVALSSSPANGGTTSGGGTSNSGSSVTVTATPATGYTFTNWTEGATVVSTNASYAFTLGANRTLVANFASIPYTVTLSSNPSAGGTTSGGGTFNSGSSVTVTATPSAGYTFTNWTEGATVVSTSASYTFTIGANRTLVANFVINTYTLTPTSGANGTITPSTVQIVNYGASSTFTVAPSTGYHVADVLVDGVSVGAVTSYPFTNVTANHTISATFAITTFTITASAGTGGAISPTGAVLVNSGTNQTFTMTPGAGYHVANVLVDGVSAGAVTSYTFNNVTAAHTIAASFAINTYTLTTTAGANGTVAPATVQTVNYGASSTFTIAPSPGYHVGDVLVDGVSVGAVTTYTFTNVTANHTISVTFAINTYTLTITATNGSVTKSPNQLTYNHGTTVQLTAIPNAGYQFAGWSGDATGSTNPVSVTMDANKAVTANFAATTSNTGSVVGAGLITSPANAYPTKPGYGGKGYFGFAAGYVKNNPLPIGLTTFALKSGGLFSSTAFSFLSLNYESLVLSGAEVTLKGEGKVNGSGSYGFLLCAIDGHATKTADKLRFKIWDKANGNAVFYDSQMGAADDADPTATVTGGVITISKTGGSSTAMDMNVQQLMEDAAAAEIPTEYALHNAYPNPFNPSTTIRFDLPEAAKVRLVVYDMLGREVTVLADGERPVGQYALRFDAGKLSSGMYIFRLQAGNASTGSARSFTQTKKLMLMK